MLWLVQPNTLAELNQHPGHSGEINQANIIVLIFHQECMKYPITSASTNVAAVLFSILGIISVAKFMGQ